MLKNFHRAKPGSGNVLIKIKYNQYEIKNKNGVLLMRINVRC